MLWRGLRFDRANVTFDAYFLLRDHDTHIDFLRLLFQVVSGATISEPGTG